MEVVRLFDAYARLLTSRQQFMLHLYYHDDLSLGEIAARVRVTRQAVFDSLRRSVSELWSLEQRIGALAARDRYARSRDAVRHRLDAVEREVARLAEVSGVDLGGLRRALRTLREIL